jgi:hypothetical protein
LFTTSNLGNAVFTWSILSWITQRSSSLDCIDWTAKYGISFYMTFDARGVFPTSIHILSHHYCSFPILILNPLVICTYYILQKRSLFFFTSTLKWCLFFNLLIVDYEIPLMLNSLLIYENVIQKVIKL